MPGNSSKKLQVVQLGFSVDFEDAEHKQYTGHNMPNWRDWDGGQIGGRPSWLQPRDLPREPMQCLNCQGNMSFVCQLYAPADDVNADAFHRSLYIFACPNIECTEATTGSIRVLRGQLPRENPFYPEVDDETWAMHLPESWDVKVCQVCNQRGHGKCPIQGLEFCGKHHQKEHKKYIFDKKQSSKDVDFSFLPSVCAESELAVEDEPGTSLSQEEMNMKAGNAMFKKGEDDDDDDDDEEDRDLEQDDLNKMIGAQSSAASKDPITMAFFERVHGKPNVQEQCLRYMRWPEEETSIEEGAPLWITQDHRPEEIPECPNCGAERRFECQLMPQMLHYLLKDHRLKTITDESTQKLKSEEMKSAIEQASSIIEQAPKEHIPPEFAAAKDKAVEAMRSRLMEGENEVSWGVVAIYTCTATCGGTQVEDSSPLGAYYEEYAWKQPSLD